MLPPGDDFEWELTKETIYLPLGCLQGGGEYRDAAPGGVVRVQEDALRLRLLPSRGEASVREHGTHEEGTS